VVSGAVLPLLQALSSRTVPVQSGALHALGGVSGARGPAASARGEAMVDGRERRIYGTDVAKPRRVAIIGASGTYGRGVLARAEEIGVEAVVVTRSPHKFRDVRPTTAIVESQLDEEGKLRETFASCDGVISALGDDRKKRPKTNNLRIKAARWTARSTTTAIFACTA